MTPTQPPRTARRLPRILVHGLLALVAAIVAIQGYELLASSPSTAASRHDGRAGLDRELLDALHQARADAAPAGINLVVKSGRRSPEHQQQLLDEAVSQYGSEEEAARWVATPQTSPHVSGDAIDISGSDAAAWLSEYGAVYGLCQIYGNEPWHYELRPEAVDQGCPPMYPDPTHDPRMNP